MLRNGKLADESCLIKIENERASLLIEAGFFLFEYILSVYK
jgi:hypothetical protein